MDGGSPSVESQRSVAPTICFVLAIAEMPVAWNHLDNAALRALCLFLCLSPSPAGNQVANIFRKQQLVPISTMPRASVPVPSDSEFRWNSLWTPFAFFEGLQRDKTNNIAGFEGRKEIVGSRFCICWTLHQSRWWETWEGLLKPRV